MEKENNLKKAIQTIRQMEMIPIKSSFATIPDNAYGIPEGDYNLKEFATVLRQHKNSPEAIEFLANLLGE